MPIYLEARNVSPEGFDGLGIIGGHMYLVYVPPGSSTDYDAWKTIGSFPANPGGAAGPWGDLQVPYTDTPLQVSKDQYHAVSLSLVDAVSEFLGFPISETDVGYGVALEAYLGYKTSSRGRQTIYDGPNEADVWTDLDCVPWSGVAGGASAISGMAGSISLPSAGR